MLAFKDIGPKAPLHELVIPPAPRRRRWPTPTDADAALYGRLMVVAAKRAKESGQAADGFRVVMNAGARRRPDRCFHVHLHVLAGRPLAWPPGLTRRSLDGRALGTQVGGGGML